MESEVAPRIPFSFVMHTSGSKCHQILHENEVLNIRRESWVSYRNGKPTNHGGQMYYINKKKSSEYETLDELLADNPLVRQLAEAHYTEPAEREKGE